MQKISALVDNKLDELLAIPETPESRVVEAMRYSALAEGKRLRPLLVLVSSGLFGVSGENAIRAAAALEMIHCYSLIHDDLPAMDDDDMRRGMPTCHKRYDEATAILAGDALLTKAFEVLADEKTSQDAGIRCALVSKLANASGDAGMIGGQMLDILAESMPPMEFDEISRLQGMKTGALIYFGCEAGAILGGINEDADEYKALTSYAEKLGLAFQITDDLLDVEGDAEQVGKAVGKDGDAGKATFVSLLGVERARTTAKEIVDSALNDISIFGDSAEFLSDIAEFVLERDK
ncbi:MAG: polyprenyl synthetase family protein [Alphaproteobacteria bacterium]|nr:polyprenyl synthetase family protein [Alphaproteobacteria bacterium]